MKIALQVDQLYDQLNRELDGFSSGARFYSVRQLMEKFNCHRGVLDRTLVRLEENELIFRVPQVGIFSNVNRRPAVHKVVFAYPEWPSELLTEWGTLAGRYVENHEEWQLRKVPIDPEQPLSVFVPPEGTDALIVFLPGAAISSEDMKWIAGLKIPLVLLNADLGSFEISNVGSDDSDGAIMACKYLYDKGHRRTAVVYAEPPNKASEARLKNFRKTAQLLSMDMLLIDCHTAQGEYSRHKAYSAMRAYLADREGRAEFTAVYAISGETVPGIMTALREYGFELPNDISIIAQTTESIGCFNHPPLTAVCVDLAAEVNAAFEGLSRIFRQECGFFRTVIPMHIIERNSVTEHTKGE